MADMKFPTRPAPQPPTVKYQDLNSNGSHINVISNNRKPQEYFKLSRSQSAGKLGEAKKPPPRPPPPPLTLLSGSNIPSSNHKKLIPGLLSRNKPTANIPKSQTSVSLSEQSRARQQTTACGMLIDLSSPPSSPTLTAHSSSDNFSLNSFSSDGIQTGVNSVSSQIESGFEDDFDSLLMSSGTTPSAPDLWTDDPFSIPRQSNPIAVPFELSNEDPRSRHKKTIDNSNTSVSTKPTIIRPKSTKPARPPPPKIRPFSTPPSFVTSPLDPPADWSPPMPSCPPPPPPPEVLETLENGPRLPPRPRPSSLIQENTVKKKPYCIALYDYDAGHPDDLSFKVNDVIHLTERINNDWLRGRLMGREGMFPASYTRVVVPLEDSQDGNVDQFHRIAIALFTFRPETWDDLSFQEGETVKVTKRIDDNWLYGECNGRVGQFPANYVTDVSSLFPLQENYS